MAGGVYSYRSVVCACGAVIVRRFFESLVLCWSASRISKGCCNGGLLGAGFLNVERKSSV